jgi:hypothetical protein
VSEVLWARVRHPLGRWWWAVAGVALCVALPVLAAATTELAKQSALRRGLSALSPGQRSVIVSYNGILDAGRVARVGAAVRARLPGLTAEPIRRQLIFRRISDGRGGAFVLGAADDLGSRVRLLDGRMPVSCTPTRCEVIALPAADADTRADAGASADSAAAAAAAGLGVVVVGHGRRVDPLLLTGTFDPGSGVPLLLADGVDAAARIQSLSGFMRSYGWVAALDLTRVRALGGSAWVVRAGAIADALDRDTHDLMLTSGLILTTPNDVVRLEDARAPASSRRTWLLLGAGALLLLGTAVAGWATAHGDQQQSVAALSGRGPRRRQIAALTAGDVLMTVTVGVLAGLLGSAALAGLLATRAGLPAFATAASAVVSALPAVLALAVLAGGLLTLTLAWQRSSRTEAA